jgi:hypothetical protein
LFELDLYLYYVCCSDNIIITLIPLSSMLNEDFQRDRGIFTNIRKVIYSVVRNSNENVTID